MKSIHILLVEDNEGDILLTTEFLEDEKIVNTISIVRDGKQAIDFLNRAGKYHTVELPDLILLDINLPRKNGHEVLQYIKSAAHLKHMPVIILTTSSAEKDINQSNYNLADGYITKPLEVGDFLSALENISDFSFTIDQIRESK